MENKYSFFQNRECEFFPCHRGADEESFNCLFCYCPLYFTPCSGNYSFTSQGIKDCSGCLFPHKRENYQKVTDLLTKEIYNRRKL